ncbi:universal stress protein [Actinoplanes sp. NEAU-A12]|uniref:Universal stress protein n=1 Tax=Actinoplanes sandaracinus TaxID=3045177 RepID=A0ABT6X219_9ACTN|nr:universal stress protein [Actinoplanes sandaracinus]MDI6105876.1 universal stress protein [Actinoplanes sandaracinus]
MTNIDTARAETEARRHTADLRRPTRFGEAINRYLGAVGYPDPYTAPPAAVGATGAVSRAERLPAAGVVVVGVDDDPISCIAVDHAAIEAELHGWALRIVNVRRSGKDGAGERLLRRLTDRVHASAPSTPVTSRLAVGPDPAQHLLTEAADAGLLVVGHRRGAAATAFGRSVADRVGRQHTGPVMVVRMPGWPVGPEWGTRPIVVAVDDSEPSRAAVEFALAEAQVRGCDVTLLHIAGDGANLAHRLDTRTNVPVHHEIISGDPVTALLEASDKAAAVVIGRDGHGVLPGPLLIAASHVLPHRAHCPVFQVG